MLPATEGRCKENLVSALRCRDQLIKIRREGWLSISGSNRDEVSTASGSDRVVAAALKTSYPSGGHS